jgi:hypothetical protein
VLHERAFIAEREFRIYGDDMAQTWALVDQVDYSFLVQWRWSWDRPGLRNGRPRRAPRMSRNMQITLPNEFDQGGGVWTNPETGVTTRLRMPRVQRRLYLHQAVMERKGDVPPSPDHILIDHINGDENDCRRGNLRWATYSMNSRNLFGADFIQGAML